MTDFGGSDELRAITEQDRADAVENIACAIRDLDGELAVIDVLGQHELQFDGARNLGYYRTFIECSCGVGWWYGVHDGDPAAIDRWAIHRAQAIREALSVEVVRRVADAKAEAVNEVADFLDGRGILWHGDSGVTVMGQPYSGQLGVRLTDWLRAQAVASEGTG